MYFKLTKENQKITTCTRLDLETPAFRPIMPKKSPWTLALGLFSQDILTCERGSHPSALMDLHTALTKKACSTPWDSDVRGAGPFDHMEHSTNYTSLCNMIHKSLCIPHVSTPSDFLSW